MFEKIVGQDSVKKSIQDWFSYETQPLLIYGPSGYGKSTFAESIGAKIIDTTHLRGDRLNTILKPIKSAEDGDILFFDEIHSLQPKILEGLYKIIDKGTFYDPELCMDLELPNVRFIFATNFIDPLPIAFKNRCRIVELQEYTLNELKSLVNIKYPELDESVLESIVMASKGVPRTALSISQSVISGLKSDKLEINIKNINNILASRMNIDSKTGLTKNEFKIIQKVIERGSLSTTAIANLLKLSNKDVKSRYIEPLRANEWLAVSQTGVIPGAKAHKNYRLFL